jgi:NADH-quinone oxidoreductase subunit C
MVMIQKIINLINNGIESIFIREEEIQICIGRGVLYKTIYMLKMHTGFQYRLLMDMWGVDNTTGKKRFELNYNILSIKYNKRVIIKVFLETKQTIETITTIYESAGWLEREVWDMFGIQILKHKDLRRILTDYGFEGNPLRKDFPVSGYYETRYDEKSKRVILEQVSFMQENRKFSFLSPWEGQDV